MEIDFLKKILFKRFWRREKERDREPLNSWLLESEANKELLERLESKSFLQQAIGENNKELRQQEWDKLQALTVKRRQTFAGYWMRVAAAILLPVLGGVLWLVKERANEADLQPVTVGQIQAGSSKAIVELAGGEQVYLTKDTVVLLEQRGVQLVNKKDTVKLSGGNAGEYHVIRIPKGGEYIARLEDGSIVHLNADSELKVPADFGRTSREVWLQGEGYFNVAKDQNRQFTVHTDKADITVLGTEFDVRVYEEENDVVTTLVNGSVEICSGDVSSRLQPGEQAQIIEPGEIKVEKVDVYPYTAWVKGRMVFVNERLEKIMADLQRWYDFEVFYTSQSIQNMRFTIDILKYDDISKVLDLIERMEKVSFTKRNRTIVVNLK